MKKILISAFKPFYKSINNYSMEVINFISSNNYIIKKEIIDVVYDECFIELSNKNNLDEYDLIIALGEARSRKVLTMEKIGHNISSCSITDNKGILKQNEKILVNNKDELYTNLHIQKCINYADISLDAGKFVCNNLYYHLLNYNPNKTLFIHIPDCNNDINLYKKYADDIISIIDLLLN